MLTTSVVLAQVVESYTALGKYLSGPALTMLITMLMSTLGLLPSSAPEFTFIWSWMMPMAACFYMMEVDLRLLKKYGGKTLFAFLIGAVGTAVGTVLSYALLSNVIGLQAWKVASSLCASCIGGSLNFAAVSQALGVSGAEMSAALASDNFIMAIYLAALMTVRVTNASPKPPPQDSSKQVSRNTNNPAEEGDEGESGDVTTTTRSSVITSKTLVWSTAGAALSCFLGDSLAILVGYPSWSLALISLVSPAVGLVIATVVRGLAHDPSLSQEKVFAGSAALGQVLMLFFFATIGATANFTDMLQASYGIFVLLLLLVSLHCVVTFFLGKAFGIPLRILLLASNANIGGPATACAMAAAKGWTDLIQPSMLVGTFGYAIGNTVGLSISQVLKLL
jgi:uncharacterized membrane protein